MNVAGGPASSAGWLGERPGSAWGMSAGVVVGDGTIGLGARASAGVGVSEARWLGPLVVVTVGTVERLTLVHRKQAERAEGDDYNQKHTHPSSRCCSKRQESYL